MSRSPLARRLVTIPLLLLLFAAVTLALPLLLAAGLIVDGWRWLGRRRHWMTTRMLVFLWFYLAGEVWAVVSLGAVALAGGRRSELATFALQQKWAAWNFVLVRRLFRLDLRIEGSHVVDPGPLVVLSRHCSLIDTLLPANLITRETGIRLRYVLKRELLVDPALDIAGNRLPNLFVDRGSGGSDRERAAIRDLATSLRTDEGVLIYPEGTRFSVAKLQRLIERSCDGDPVRKLQNVLPPRTGGTLAILEATTADVIVLGHAGLEGFATVAEIWGGDLVGSTVRVSFRRIPRHEVPAGRGERIEWLQGVWEDLDHWVGSTRSAEG